MRHLILIFACALLVSTAAGQRPKEIQDPAEYNSYVSAIQMTDPQRKAAALEDFVMRFSNSVVREDAFE
jgi:hypothetical protein